MPVFRRFRFLLPINETLRRWLMQRLFDLSASGEKFGYTEAEFPA